MGGLEAFLWSCVCQSIEQEAARKAGLPDTSQRGGCLCFRNIHVDGKELSGPFMSLPETGELSFDFSYRRTVPPGCRHCCRGCQALLLWRLGCLGVLPSGALVAQDPCIVASA